MGLARLPARGPGHRCPDRGRPGPASPVQRAGDRDGRWWRRRIPCRITVHLTEIAGWAAADAVISTGARRSIAGRRRVGGGEHGGRGLGRERGVETVLGGWARSQICRSVAPTPYAHSSTWSALLPVALYFNQAETVKSFRRAQRAVVEPELVERTREHIRAVWFGT
jgi:hypothetical protein